MTDRLNAYAPHLLSVLRIVAALLFIAHGTGKYFDFPALGMPTPSPFSLFGVAGLIEIVGGLLVLIGFYTRIAAFIMSGEMAVAYFTARTGAGKALAPIANGGNLDVAYCFLFLYLVFAGAGPWSLDAVLRKRT